MSAKGAVCTLPDICHVYSPEAERRISDESAQKRENPIICHVYSPHTHSPEAETRISDDIFDENAKKKEKTR